MRKPTRAAYKELTSELNTTLRLQEPSQSRLAAVDRFVLLPPEPDGRQAQALAEHCLGMEELRPPTDTPSS
jgi:hypothetical protein